MRTCTSSRLTLALAFAHAARIYWLNIFPCLRSELRHWRGQAEGIPDPVLRHTALEAQRTKLGNIEGAVAFATFAGPSNRALVVRAVASYEAILDYLDCLCEMPNPDPITNGRQLNQALITAVEPNASHIDYYAYHSRHSDNGYLRHLVDACRSAFCPLPSHAVVIEAARRASTRIAHYQSLNHGDTHGSHRLFEHWAIEETANYRKRHPNEDVRWWEIGASAGSSVAVFALIAAAADPATQPKDVAAIERAYFPWIGAVNSLLDSFIDQQEDSAPGQHRILDYYASLNEAAVRLEFIVTEAVHRARQLASGDMHTMILAAMVSFYLSDPKAGMPDMRVVCESIRATMGNLEKPTRIIMSARRAASRIA